MRVTRTDLINNVLSPESLFKALGVNDSKSESLKPYLSEQHIERGYASDRTGARPKVRGGGYSQSSKKEIQEGFKCSRDQ